jgi:hypothetical protein
MFAVPGDETIALAAASNLDLIFRLNDQPAFSTDPAVYWTLLAFRKPA